MSKMKEIGVAVLGFGTVGAGVVDTLQKNGGLLAERLGLRRNTLAVAIPCHRVVRRDGDLSGYRWGIERKQQLLDRETASS